MLCLMLQVNASFYFNFSVLNQDSDLYLTLSVPKHNHKTV